MNGNGIMDNRHYKLKEAGDLSFQRVVESAQTIQTSPSIKLKLTLQTRCSFSACGSERCSISFSSAKLTTFFDSLVFDQTVTRLQNIVNSIKT